MTINDVVNKNGSLNYATIGGFKDRLDAHDSSLAENALNPDNYTGTDLQKVQSAINDAIANSRGINFWRVFDITGGTLKLNKTGRTPIVFTGINKGGLKKTDSGFVFTSDLTLVSDFFFNTMYFESVAGAGTKIFNSDKILIVKTTGCIYRYVDTLDYTSDTGYVQSYRHINDQCLGGNGSFFDIVGSYDTSIDECYFENRQDVFIHRSVTSAVNQNNLMFNLRIVNSIFQSVRNAILIVGKRGVKLDSLYFEGNTSDIVFVKNPDGLDYNVTVSNCGDYGTSAPSLIKWGASQNTAISINNHCLSIPIHDFSAITSGYILGINDGASSNIGATGKYYNMTQNSYITNGLQFGPFKKYKLSSGSITIPANTTQTVTFTFPENLEPDDTISVQIQPNSNNINDKYAVNYYFRDFTTKTNLYVNYSNNNASSGTITIFASVIKLFPNI